MIAALVKRISRPLRALRIQRDHGVVRGVGALYLDTELLGSVCCTQIECAARAARLIHEVEAQTRQILGDASLGLVADERRRDASTSGPPPSQPMAKASK